MYILYIQNHEFTPLAPIVIKVTYPNSTNTDKYITNIHYSTMYDVYNTIDIYDIMYYIY